MKKRKIINNKGIKKLNLFLFIILILLAFVIAIIYLDNYSENNQIYEDGLSSLLKKPKIPPINKFINKFLKSKSSGTTSSFNINKNDVISTPVILNINDFETSLIQINFRCLSDQSPEDDEFSIKNKIINLQAPSPPSEPTVSECFNGADGRKWQKYQLIPKVEEKEVLINERTLRNVIKKFCLVDFNDQILPGIDGGKGISGKTKVYFSDLHNKLFFQIVLRYDEQKKKYFYVREGEGKVKFPGDEKLHAVPPFYPAAKGDGRIEIPILLRYHKLAPTAENILKTYNYLESFHKIQDQILWHERQHVKDIIKHILPSLEEINLNNPPIYGGDNGFLLVDDARKHAFNVFSKEIDKQIPLPTHPPDITFSDIYSENFHECLKEFERVSLIKIAPKPPDNILKCLHLDFDAFDKGLIQAKCGR